MSQIFARPSIVAAALALLCVVPLLVNPYQLYIVSLSLIFVLLATGLNLLLGYAGQLAFSNIAIFGVGAYATGILRVDLGLVYAFAVPLGAIVATAVGVVAALPALRLRGLYLALATIAFAEFAVWVFAHWEPVTRGVQGLQVPQPDFSMVGLSREIGVYYTALSVVTVLVTLLWNALRSRIGRAFVAIRESEAAAETLGIDLTRFKTLAYAISAFVAGVAGGLFAMLLGLVVPDSFASVHMITQFAMVTVGGLGSLWGAILGAALLTWLTEVLRVFRDLQEIVYGGMLLAAVLFLRRGLIDVVKRRVPGWSESLRRKSRP